MITLSCRVAVIVNLRLVESSVDIIYTRAQRRDSQVLPVQMTTLKHCAIQVFWQSLMCGVLCSTIPYSSIVIDVSNEPSRPPACPAMKWAMEINEQWKTTFIIVKVTRMDWCNYYHAFAVSATVVKTTACANIQSEVLNAKETWLVRLSLTHTSFAYH